MYRKFLSLAFLSFALTANAQTTSQTVSLVSPGNFSPGTYYGTKAGDGMFNPCSGKTKRVCAEIKVIPVVNTDYGINPLSLNDGASASESTSSIEL